MLNYQFECCGPYSLDEDGEDLRGAKSWDFYKSTNWYMSKSQSKLSVSPVLLLPHRLQQGHLYNIVCPLLSPVMNFESSLEIQ